MWVWRERGRPTPFEAGVSPLACRVASGSPASFRWGRKEFGWSQRPGQDTQVVGGYVSPPSRSFVHEAEFAARRPRTLLFGAAGQGFFWLAGGHRGGDRQSDPGPRAGGPEEEGTLRAGRAPAEGPQTVDGERDRGREMARVAGPAAARCEDRAADRRARPLEQADRRLMGVHARPLAHEH